MEVSVFSFVALLEIWSGEVLIKLSKQLLILFEIGMFSFFVIKLLILFFAFSINLFKTSFVFSINKRNIIIFETSDKYKSILVLNILIQVFLLIQMQ